MRSVVSLHQNDHVENILRKQYRDFFLVSCLVCGKNWHKRKIYAVRDKPHFCSAKCLAHARRLGKYGKPLQEIHTCCAVCGMQVRRKPSEVPKSGKSFCSRTCLALGIKGGLVARNPIRSDHPDAGRSQARRLFPQDEPCVECGATRSERHHIDGNTFNNAPSNIRRLCAKCHIRADRRPHLARISKIGVPRSIRLAKRDSSGKFIARLSAEVCTPSQWFEIKQKFKFRCAMCGVPESQTRLEKDHVIPLSKGGSKHWTNVQPLCRKCNAIKSNRTPGVVTPREKDA